MLLSGGVYVSSLIYNVSSTVNVMCMIIVTDESEKLRASKMEYFQDSIRSETWRESLTASQ